MEDESHVNRDHTRRPTTRRYAKYERDQAVSDPQQPLLEAPPILNGWVLPVRVEVSVG